MTAGMFRSTVFALILAVASFKVTPTFAGSVAATPSTGARVVEYHHSGLDHYFITANLTEQAMLDGGQLQGWMRTGAWFDVESPTSPSTTSSPVCRFYGRPDVGLDSHFYSASPDECMAVARKFAGSWIYESSNVFRVQLADPVTGTCPAHTVPIYRLFNNRSDANHRYVVDRALRDGMARAGHIPEGYGPDHVAFCVKAVASFTGMNEPSEPASTAPPNSAPSPAPEPTPTPILTPIPPPPPPPASPPPSLPPC